MPAAQGKDLWGIVAGIEQGSIKALYLLGCDLAGFPDNGRIRKALAKLELLIVQDIFEGDSLDFAHVVFPAAAAAEKSGSFTSTDNRVQAIFKAVNPPGQARQDGEIIAELYSRLSSGTQRGSAPALVEGDHRAFQELRLQQSQVGKGRRNSERRARLCPGLQGHRRGATEIPAAGRADRFSQRHLHHALGKQPGRVTVGLP